MSSLKKITREVLFNGAAWEFKKHVNGISIYFNVGEDCAIIVDSNDNILFQIDATIDCRHAVLECV